MKKIFFAAICMAVAVCLPTQTNAQKARQISAEDKKAIIELFKGVDPKSYRLEFAKGKEVYGARKVSIAEVDQVSKIRNPGGQNGYVVLAVRDDGVMFVLATTKGNIASTLGEEKAKQLNAIMAKYSR